MLFRGYYSFNFVETLALNFKKTCVFTFGRTDEKWEWNRATDPPMPWNNLTNQVSQ